MVDSWAGVVAPGCLFLWPTPWEYGVEYWGIKTVDKHGKFLGERVPVRVRTNRFTGEKQNQGGPEGEWGHFVW